MTAIEHPSLKEPDYSRKAERERTIRKLREDLSREEYKLREEDNPHVWTRNALKPPTTI